MKHLFFSGVILGIAGAAQAHESHEPTSLPAHPDRIVAAGQGTEVDNPFHPVELLLSHEESQGAVTIYKFTLPPKNPGSPPHTHSREDEYFYVLSGRLDVLVDGDVRQLEPGDFAVLNRGHTHMFWNGSDSETELLMTTTGGSFEAFMSSAGPQIAAEKPATPDEAGAIIARLAAEHGITISMAEMPEEAARFYAPPAPE
ncbi:cupin domain-containing protein [Henriciella sp.]|uniref:cupin domain-containing protein n=1 Tax=Henriciella sp. TaxID=1968823 RepID=UPI00260DC9E1|nr:cupin domain-containing protein [Henriciella sp.]